MTRDEIADLVNQVADLPEAAQDEVAASIAAIAAQYAGVYRLDPEERAAVRRGFEEIRRGKFASDEQVAAVFARFRGE